MAKNAYKETENSLLESKHKTGKRDEGFRIINRLNGCLHDALTRNHVLQNIPQ